MLTASSKISFSEAALKVKGSSKKISKDPGSNEMHQCPFCDRTFAKKQSLGGHTSHAHAGKSLIFAKKVEIRNQRAPLLKMSKAARSYIKEVNLTLKQG